MELDEITYPISKKSLGKLPELLEQQRKTLTDMGLAPEEIERALAPTIAFMAGVREDVERYEQHLDRLNTL